MAQNHRARLPSLAPPAPPPAPPTVPPSLPLPDPRTAEELAQWNQYLVKLGEQVASSVYAHALGLAPPPPPPPSQYLDPTALAQFGLTGMPGLLSLGLGLGGLPGLGMLGAAALAAWPVPRFGPLGPAATTPPAAEDHRAPSSSASPLFAALEARAANAVSVRPSLISGLMSLGLVGLLFRLFSLAGSPPFTGGVGAMGVCDKRSVAPLKAAPPAPVKEKDEDDGMSVDGDGRPTTRLASPAPVEPRLGMCTPGIPAKLANAVDLVYTPRFLRHYRPRLRKTLRPFVKAAPRHLSFIPIEQSAGTATSPGLPSVSSETVFLFG
ncbi:hypothetical protein CTheo_4103 [Ceratobasidium theobromae]|uniref:Transmembrane protein n=1 Tax=Ceratobasidium theobromae TaxID=1582974 RepID=A0A5N5QMR0_9AGAM|nr:hypothetical protein CTheo_4103 [Ceratobasidium theobromae]